MPKLYWDTGHHWLRSYGRLECEQLARRGKRLVGVHCGFLQLEPPCFQDYQIDIHIWWLRPSTATHEEKELLRKNMVKLLCPKWQEHQVNGQAVGEGLRCDKTMLFEGLYLDEDEWLWHFFFYGGNKVYFTCFVSAFGTCKISWSWPFWPMGRLHRDCHKYRAEWNSCCSWPKQSFKAPRTLSVSFLKVHETRIEIMTANCCCDLLWFHLQNFRRGLTGMSVSTKISPDGPTPGCRATDRYQPSSRVWTTLSGVLLGGFLPLMDQWTKPCTRWDGWKILFHERFDIYISLPDDM